MTSIIHSLFDNYLAKDDQMVSAKRKKFFLVPYDDLCFNRRNTGPSYRIPTASPSAMLFYKMSKTTH